MAAGGRIGMLYGGGCSFNHTEFRNQGQGQASGKSEAFKHDRNDCTHEDTRYKQNVIPQGTGLFLLANALYEIVHCRKWNFLQLLNLFGQGALSSCEVLELRLKLLCGGLA